MSTSRRKADALQMQALGRLRERFITNYENQRFSKAAALLFFIEQKKHLWYNIIHSIKRRGLLAEIFC